jgi:hypothetical protein
MPVTFFAPELMTAHVLGTPKGWFQPAALDFVAKISNSVNFLLYAGRVVHLDINGEFVPGVGETDMAIFLLQAANSFDVANPGLTPTGKFMHQAILPAGNSSGLVAKGAYELESSEFDATQPAYAPGDLLTSVIDLNNSAVGGVLTNVGSGSFGDVKQFVDPVCGVVSSGTRTTEHGTLVLRFWPVYLPGVYSS